LGYLNKFYPNGLKNVVFGGGMAIYMKADYLYVSNAIQGFLELQKAKQS